MAAASHTLLLFDDKREEDAGTSATPRLCPAPTAAP